MIVKEETIRRRASGMMWVPSSFKLFFHVNASYANQFSHCDIFTTGLPWHQRVVHRLELDKQPHDHDKSGPRYNTHVPSILGFDSKPLNNVLSSNRSTRLTIRSSLISSSLLTPTTGMIDGSLVAISSLVLCRFWHWSCNLSRALFRLSSGNRENSAADTGCLKFSCTALKTCPREIPLADRIKSGQGHGETTYI